MIVVMLMMSGFASAQKTELAITAGGNFPQTSGFDTGSSFAFGVNFAARFIHVPLAALYGEAPVLVATHSVQRLTTPTSYSSTFFTPGLKLKFAPEFPISPYVAMGAGIAYFNATSGAADGRTDTKFVWDWAAGADLKVFWHLSLRGEVRDYYAGKPSFTLATGDQHDLAAQLGMVFRF
jgi:opacity protein-like surface antigen